MWYDIYIIKYCSELLKQEMGSYWKSTKVAMEPVFMVRFLLRFNYCIERLQKLWWNQFLWFASCWGLTTAYSFNLLRNLRKLNSIWFYSILTNWIYREFIIVLWIRPHFWSAKFWTIDAINYIYTYIYNTYIHTYYIYIYIYMYIN